MYWDSAQVNWQQFRCEVQANWGRLTSGHLDVIAGRRACFEARNQHPRPVSFR